MLGAFHLTTNINLSGNFEKPSLGFSQLAPAYGELNPASLFSSPFSFPGLDLLAPPSLFSNGKQASKSKKVDNSISQAKIGQRRHLHKDLHKN